MFIISPLSPPKFNEKGEITNEPRIPIEYLKKLFGLEVENALKILQGEMEKRLKVRNQN